MASQTPPSVGIIVNPASGRDIRRLYGWATLFSTAEKINIVMRLLVSLGQMGIRCVWMPPDHTGIAREVLRSAHLASRSRELPMPEVRLLDMPVSGSTADSTHAAQSMRSHGVRSIAVLGGDGTHRAVALGCGDTPLAAISTGTNNAFPEPLEATVVGVAMALHAWARVDDAVAVRSNKRLLVRGNGWQDTALVDVAVTHQINTGAGAIDDAADLCELFVSFAQPDAVGLSSIAGLILPTPRDAAHGVHVRLGPGRWLHAPLMPGLLAHVPIGQAEPLWPGKAVTLAGIDGTLALDGERRIEIRSGDPIAVEIDAHGPRTLEVSNVLAHAAIHGLLVTP